MESITIHPQTLPADLEILIGRAFEDDGKKRQFAELEHFFDMLKTEGYSFNFIRELKQFKVIPFKKFTCNIHAHKKTGASRHETEDNGTQSLQVQKEQAVEAGNFELAAALMNQEASEKNASAPHTSSSTAPANNPLAIFNQKILKTHVVVEHRMIHIYLITKQEQFADKVQYLAWKQPPKKLEIEWFKRLVGATK